MAGVVEVREAGADKVAAGAGKVVVEAGKVAGEVEGQEAVPEVGTLTDQAVAEPAGGADCRAAVLGEVQAGTAELVAVAADMEGARPRCREAPAVQAAGVVAERAASGEAMRIPTSTPESSTIGRV